MKFLIMLEVNAILHIDVKELVNDELEEIKHDIKRFFELPMQREINATIITDMTVLDIAKES